MKKTKEKGITLIALVVTIIILLILAGVTIGIATNGTGLFDKAKLATDEYNNRVQKEEKEINRFDDEVETYVDGNRGYEEAIKGLQDQIDELKNKNQFTITSLGSANKGVNLPINADLYDEIYVEVYCQYNSTYASYRIPTATLTTSTKAFSQQSSWSDGIWTSISISKTRVILGTVRRDNADRAGSMTVYGIKY